MLHLFLTSFLVFQTPADEPAAADALDTQAETLDPPAEPPSPDIEKKAEDLPTPGDESRTTNTGESFKDPFSEPPVEPTPDSNSESVFPTEDFKTPASTPTPKELVAPAPAPSLSAEPAPPPAPSFTLPPPPKKTFNFPMPDDLKGPVTQEYFETRQFANEKKNGLWNLGIGLGAGFNMNRRHQQIHFELNGGYRQSELLEIFGVAYYRAVKDTLIGFLLGLRWDYILMREKTTRIDFLPGLSLGWALREPPSVSHITEGRMPIRLSGDFLFYATPRFAITSLLAVESFLFSLSTDGDATNFMNKDGPPTQLLLTLGTRWEF